MKARNPQMFQFLEQARKNNNDPINLLKDITKNYTPEQYNGLFDKAKQFGISDEKIKEIKDGINIK